MRKEEKMQSDCHYLLHFFCIAYLYCSELVPIYLLNQWFSVCGSWDQQHQHPQETF